MAIQDSTFPLQDALLFFHEPPLQIEADQQQQQDDDDVFVELQTDTSSSLLHVHVTDEDLRWSDDELTTLLKNETEHPKLMKERDPEAQVAVKWMMRVVAHYGFAPVTGILAADYFDRFMSEFDKHHHICIVEKLWTLQLTAVACLSLAAKVEETQALPLLDLQVEEAKFMFEPKTIQRMELLVLSTLHWRMHPVTPFSFIDHIIRRLELKPSSQIEFLDQSNRILTSLVTDSRWGFYSSSALAFATMIHVMEQVETTTIDDYQNLLFSAHITINKEKVSECYKLIQELNTCSRMSFITTQQVLDSPKAVIDHASSSYLLTSDSSNDSWNLNSTTTLLHEPSSSELPALKRARYNDEVEDVKRSLIDSTVASV